MPNPMNRRHLIAGAAAVPLLPAAARGANLPLAEPDPAVAAYERWLAANAAERRYPYENDIPNCSEDAGWLALNKAETEAAWALIEAPATTPAGALGKLHLYLTLTGCADDIDADVADPTTFDMGVTCQWYDGRDHEAGLSVLRSLRQMGGQA